MEERNNNFYEDDNSQSLTLKDIYKGLKLSFVRIVVYVMITVLLGTAIMMVVRSVAVNKNFESQITFNNREIEAGLSPWDGTINISNKVKSSYNVSKALSNVGLTEEEITNCLDRVISGLMVTAIVVEDKEKDETKKPEVYAYKYRITLEYNKSLNWDNNKYVAVVDAITDQYISSFRSDYSYRELAKSIENVNLKTLDYIQVGEAIRQTIAYNDVILKSLVEDGDSFRSTNSGYTFSELSAINKSLIAKINVLESYIVNTGVQRNIEPSELNYINQKIKILSKQEDALIKECADLATAVDKAKPPGDNIIGGGAPIEGANKDKQYAYYAALIEKYTNKLAELTSVSIECAKWTEMNNIYVGKNLDFNDDIKTPPEKKAAIRAATDALITEIKNELTGTATAINKTIEDYNASDRLKNYIKKTLPAKVNVSPVLNMMALLCIDGALLIGATICAIAVTKKKGKMYLRKKEVTTK